MSTLLEAISALAFASVFAPIAAHAQQLSYKVLSLACKKDLAETTYESCTVDVAVTVRG
jgi:hypothetical protein